jgi:hypothetical protein
MLLLLLVALLVVVALLSALGCVTSDSEDFGLRLPKRFSFSRTERFFVGVLEWLRLCAGS